MNAEQTGQLMAARRRELGLFLLPDTRDISSYPEQLPDEAGQPLDQQGFRESDAASAPLMD